jgi:type II secretory pathway pseudopilin PulG
MQRCSGVTYIALLLAVAITSGLAASGGAWWSQQQRREREVQLLWAGDQIRRALAAYARAGPVPVYPETLDDLLLDARSVAPRRHLRRIHDDPMTNGMDWELIRNPQGRIIGVHSRSGAAPLKTGSFAARDAHFERARSYRDWTFLVTPPVLPAAGAAAPARAASAAQTTSEAAPVEAGRPTGRSPRAAPPAPPADEPDDSNVEPPANPAADPD